MPGRSCVASRLYGLISADMPRTREKPRFYPHIENSSVHIYGHIYGSGTSLRIGQHREPPALPSSLIVGCGLLRHPAPLPIADRPTSLSA